MVSLNIDLMDKSVNTKIDSLFFLYVTNLSEVSELAWQGVKAIEGTVYDRELDLIRTPYGLTTRDNLSSGAKTLLYVDYLQRVNEVGKVSSLSAGHNAFIEIIRYLYAVVKNGGVQYAIPCISATSVVLDIGYPDLEFNYKGLRGSFLDIKVHLEEEGVL